MYGAWLEWHLPDPQAGRPRRKPAKARPVLDAMLADVRAGRVEAVAIWSLDRLGRGFACFDLFRELSRLGVRILSVRERGPTWTAPRASCWPRSWRG